MYGGMGNTKRLSEFYNGHQKNCSCLKCGKHNGPCLTQYWSNWTLC